MTNYDFATNWATEIVPLLELDEVKQSITKGIKSYIKRCKAFIDTNTPNYDMSKVNRYSKYKYPYEYCRANRAEKLWEEIEIFKGDKYTELLQNRRLRRDPNEPKRNRYDTEERYLDALYHYELKTEDYIYHYEQLEPHERKIESDNEGRYWRYKERKLKPYIETFKKNNWRTYALYGGCHWWNTTFGLTLAKLVMPNENWEIIKGLNHTTIANADKTKIFDILYYDTTSEDFGGKNALYLATTQYN